MSSTKDSTKHVAVLAFPFGSHPLSLLDLVRKLVAAAPDTQFSFLNTEKSNNFLLLASKAKLPENIKVYNVADGVSLDHVFSGDPIERVELFLNATPENFNKGLDLAVAETGQKISCLITDAFLSFSGSIAKDMGVSWIPVWFPLPQSLSAHIYTDMIQKNYAYTFSGSGEDDAIPEDKTLESIPGLSNVHISDLPNEVLSLRGTQETLFSSMLSQIGQMLPQATALVMNFYEELYPKPLLLDLKSKCPNLLNAGFLTLSVPPTPLPLSDTDSTGCLSWLDGHKENSVAYISFGTVVNIPVNEIEELAEALEATRIPFLWSLRENLKENLPNGFLERTRTHGKVVPWAPQVQVLAHSSIGVFLTHCGAISVYESIVHGVPMICRPFFADHKMNGRLIEDVWGVGVRVDGGVFTKNGVMKSLELIFVQEQGRKIRTKVQALKELVWKAAAPGGHATQDFKILVEKISLL